MKDKEVSEVRVRDEFRERATADLSDITFITRGDGPTIRELREQQKEQQKKEANSGKPKPE